MGPNFRRTLCSIVVVVCLASSAGADDALTTYAYTPGWATFGFALPRGAATGAVQVGALPTQTDVKVRWPDGSIRFAVVSANIPAGGNYTIRPAAATTAIMPAPATPSVSVTLTIRGRAYVARLPAARADPWLNGPLVVESRAIVAPDDHPFLRVIFDLRSYAGGGHRVFHGFVVPIHPVENEIGATVHDSKNPGDTVARERVAQRSDDGDCRGYGRFVIQLRTDLFGGFE